MSEPRDTFSVSINSETGNVLLVGKPQFRKTKVTIAQYTSADAVGPLYRVKTVYVYRTELPKYFFEARKIPKLIESENAFKILSDNFERIAVSNRAKVILRNFNIVSREFMVIIVVEGMSKDNKIAVAAMRTVNKIYREKIVPIYRVPFIEYLKQNKLRYPGLHY